MKGIDNLNPAFYVNMFIVNNSCGYCNRLTLFNRNVTDERPNSDAFNLPVSDIRMATLL